MDQDSNWYHTVTIGRLTFMVENLRTTTYNDGTKIPVIRDNQAWGSATGPACCHYNHSSYYDSNGMIYNHYAYATGKLAPNGWHVATNEEWGYVDSLCRTRYSQNYLYALVSKTGWDSSAVVGSPGNVVGRTNETSLSITPIGYRDHQGFFQSAGKEALYWGVQDPFSSNYAFVITFSYSATAMRFNFINKKLGFPVRCVKD
jgi:uncharacterized protein (TIGR02145 family)